MAESYYEHSMQYHSTLWHAITRYTAPPPTPLQEPLFITSNSDLKQQQT